MSTSGLPPIVTWFIGEHIESVEQMEVLLLLWRQAPAPWSADEVGRELRIADASAAQRLSDLAHRGLAAQVEGPPGAFRYAPESRKLDEAVAALNAAYGERRVSVINDIFSRPTEKIRTFADAFRVGRN